MFFHAEEVSFTSFWEMYLNSAIVKSDVCIRAVETPKPPKRPPCEALIVVENYVVKDSKLFKEAMEYAKKMIGKNLLLLHGFNLKIYEKHRKIQLLYFRELNAMEVLQLRKGLGH